jgi:hypothetical protein
MAVRRREIVASMRCNRAARCRRQAVQGAMHEPTAMYRPLSQDDRLVQVLRVLSNKERTKMICVTVYRSSIDC